jgi:hypothetical protein
MWRRRYRVSASPRLSHRRVVEFSPRSMATTTTALQTSCCQGIPSHSLSMPHPLYLSHISHTLYFRLSASSRRDNRSPPPLLSRPPPPPASLWKLLLGLDSSGWMAQKGAFAGHPHHHARMLGRTRPCKRRTTSLGGASAAPVSEAVTAFTDAAFHELFPSELPWPTFFAAGGVGRGRWVRSSYSVPSSTLSSCREKKKGGTAMLQHHHESLHHSSPACGALEKPLQ